MEQEFMTGIHISNLAGLMKMGGFRPPSEKRCCETHLAQPVTYCAKEEIWLKWFSSYACKTLLIGPLPKDERGNVDIAKGEAKVHEMNNRLHPWAQFALKCKPVAYCAKNPSGHKGEYAFPPGHLRIVELVVYLNLPTTSADRVGAWATTGEEAQLECAHAQWYNDTIQRIGKPIRVCVWTSNLNSALMDY